MSEPSATPKPPRRPEGVEEPTPPSPTPGLSKTGGGQERDDGRNEGSGGMIGEADTGREGGMTDEG